MKHHSQFTLIVFDLMFVFFIIEVIWCNSIAIRLTLELDDEVFLIFATLGRVLSDETFLVIDFNRFAGEVVCLEIRENLRQGLSLDIFPHVEQ